MAITSRRNLRVSITGDEYIGYLEQFRTVYQPDLYRKSTLDWKESVACYYWERNLKHLCKYYDTKFHDFGFAPVAYYDIKSINDLKKRGTEGEHFAEGWESLYNLIEKYGVFNEDKDGSTGLPYLFAYKGPPLPNNNKKKPPPPTTVRALARSVSLSPEARDSNRTTADQLSIANFKGGGSEAKDTLSQISEADWGHRRSDNYMSYAYLEKSLNDLKNYVFVGRVQEEICSLFVCRFTGRDSEDATIVLLWTKDTWLRNGFCAKIMNEGIRFLGNKSHMMAGTSTTPTTGSRAVFRSQQWNGIDDSMLSVLLQNLRKTLEKKRYQKGAKDDGDWEEKIPSCFLEYYRAEFPSRRDGNIGYLKKFRTVYQPKLYRKSRLNWKESVACYYWEHNLKHLWKYYDAKLEDFVFVPVAYYDIKSINDLKKRGTEGEHFAEGYESLYNLIEKYGVFNEDKGRSTGLPSLLAYKGPPLPNNNKKKLPAAAATGRSLARSVSLSPEARDSNRTTADQLSIANFKGGGPEAKATLSQISEADWGHRRSDNYMSYAYLEKSLNDLKNYVLVGRVQEEICSLFVYRFTGRDSEDATIVLLWTKDTWRRSGFCTKIMHEGIGFLDNKSLMMAGTSTTPTTGSRAVFRSQQWNGIDDSMLSVLLQSLRKTLEKKRFQKGAEDDSNSK